MLPTADGGITTIGISSMSTELIYCVVGKEKDLVKERVRARGARDVSIAARLDTLKRTVFSRPGGNNPKHRQRPLELGRREKEKAREKDWMEKEKGQSSLN